MPAYFAYPPTLPTRLLCLLAYLPTRLLPLFFFCRKTIHQAYRHRIGIEAAVHLKTVGAGIAHQGVRSPGSGDSLQADVKLLGDIVLEAQHDTDPGRQADLFDVLAVVFLGTDPKIPEEFPAVNKFQFFSHLPAPFRAGGEACIEVSGSVSVNFGVVEIGKPQAVTVKLTGFKLFFVNQVEVADAKHAQAQFMVDHHIR